MGLEEETLGQAVTEEVEEAGRRYTFHHRIRGRSRRELVEEDTLQFMHTTSL